MRPTPLQAVVNSSGFETAPTVLDATALLIPFACYWELANIGHLPTSADAHATSTGTVDSIGSADGAACEGGGGGPAVLMSSTGSFHGSGKRRMLPPGWAMPTMPPMMLQLLVGRFVRHIGWVRQDSGVPRGLGSTPTTPWSAKAGTAARNITPDGRAGAAIPSGALGFGSSHGSRAMAIAAAATAAPMTATASSSVTDADAEIDVLMVRGRSTSYWEGDDDGSSTRGTPNEDVYVQDEESQVVVRQGQGGLLSGGMPPPFTGNPESLEGDEEALLAFKRTHTSIPAKFRFPTGLTCLPNGLLAVCSDENRITIINQHGFVIKRHSSVGGLRFPRGLTALGGALLCIADGAHHRLIILDYTTGRVVRELGRLGIPGDGIDDFNCPSGTALVPGNPDVLAVCDQMNHRVKLVNWRTGRCVKIIGSGHRGAGEDEFNGPWGITSLHLHDCFNDASEAVRMQRYGEDEPINPVVAFAVCDQDNHRVKIITSTGAFIRHIGGSPRGGSGVDDFSRPRGLVALDGGILCITDICNHRIKVVNAKTGACLRIFSSITTGCMNRILQDTLVLNATNNTDSPNARQQQRGAALHAENLYPLGITALPGGDIAVGDRDNHRITVLRP